MKYDRRWSADLKGDEKKNFEDLLGVNNKVLDRLVEICYNMVKNSEVDTSDYDSPNWAYKQADKVGYRRALRQIIMLCTSQNNKET